MISKNKLYVRRHVEGEWLKYNARIMRADLSCVLFNLFLFYEKKWIIQSKCT